MIVQHVQKTSFLKKESTIWRLNPKMKNGVMVVGGRLANAPVAWGECKTLQDSSEEMLCHKPNCRRAP